MRRTYSLKSDSGSLYTLAGQIPATIRPGEHQRRILESGQPKEAEPVLRKGKWFFNLLVDSGEVRPLASGPGMGVDVGEINLAATSAGKVFGGEHLRNKRDRIKAGERVRGRLHRQAWRQLQTFVEYKAKAAGIAVE